MMTFVSCNPYFHKEAYVSLLNKMDVNAQIVENGVLMDLDQYKKNYRSSKAPYLINSNHCFIKKLYNK